MAACIYWRAKANSLYAVVITVVIHGLVIWLLIEFKSIESAPYEPSIQMIPIKLEKIESVFFVEPPSIDFEPQIINPIVPNINFSDEVHADLKAIHFPSDVPYELPDAIAAKYSDVFDPRMRQKLIEAQSLNKPRAKEKSNSWTEADGRTFVDMGDGHCLVSMPKTDPRERGTNWGHARCGKTNSEKMMDNVAADLEARKHPLNSK